MIPAANKSKLLLRGMNSWRKFAGIKIHSNGTQQYFCASRIFLVKKSG
jgi:hypothetical protein